MTRDRSVTMRAWIQRSAVIGGITAAVFVSLVGATRYREHSTWSRQLTTLVAAVGAHRVVEPRLTGGFAYGPVRSPVRTEPSPEDVAPDVRIALAEIEKSYLRNPTAETFALLGLAHLATGDAAKAVSTLEEAASVESANAAIRSNLAAAYLVRAREANDAQDLPKALVAADFAVRADPLLLEGRFNLALSLERLHLDDLSRVEWEEYVRLDPHSSWTDEAQSHLALRGERLAVSPDAQALQIAVAASSADTDVLTRAVEQMIPSARQWTEEQLLGAWPAALTAGDLGGAGAVVRRASRVARALAVVTGDRYLLDAAGAVERTSGMQAVNLARAHAAFKRAMDLYEQNDFSESGRMFSSVRHPLEQARSPFALGARLQGAITAYYASDIVAAQRDVDLLIPAAERLRYLRFLGLAHRMRGLLDSVSGRFGDSLDHNTRAFEAFRQSADLENVAAIESSIAENLEFLGEPRRAWVHRLQALAGLSHVQNLRRRHTILISSMLSCLRQGSPQAAAYFQSSVLRNAERWNRPEALAEAHVREAELHGQIGAFAQVPGDLDAARLWLGRVHDERLSRQLEARIHLASASFTTSNGSHGDEAALTEALAFLRRAGLSWALAKAYLARGRVYAARGRADLAEDDFLNGMREFEKQRASLSADALRVSYFDQPWDLFSEMVRLQVRVRRRPDAALSVAERSRARTLLESIKRSGDAAPFEVSDIQRRLDPGVAIVFYSVLDDETFIWRLTKEHLDFFEAKIRETELTRQVNRLRDEMARATLPSDDAAANLYDILLRAAIAEVPAGTTLVFIPDGVVHGVPFGALVDRRTHRYLVQDRPLVVAPSASVFLEATSAQRTRTAHSFVNALVIGDPALGEASGVAPPPDLPDARREVSDVAKLYDRADVVTAGEATKRRFLDEFDQHDVIHFAGHAISNSDFPDLSRLLFAGSGAVDDSLFAHELSGARFRRAQVLVLAACETSGGRVRRGEGVLSLARPFLGAGVPTVVASLWDADDRATRVLLVRFHQALRDGVPAAQALRLAQVAAIGSPDASLRTPSKWAGFEVIGAIGQQAVEPTVWRQR
jgi:CHAT domain-containing protein